MWPSQKLPLFIDVATNILDMEWEYGTNEWARNEWISFLKELSTAKQKKNVV